MEEPALCLDCQEAALRRLLRRTCEVCGAEFTDRMVKARLENLRK